MARYRGHFFNWYDTRDLNVLAPRYVSSVDSGNLAGHLIALANACREWRVSSPDAASRRAGVGDMISLLGEEAARLGARSRTQTVTPRQLEDSLAAISRTLAQTPGDDAAMTLKWAQLAKEGANLTDIANAIALESRDEPESDLLFWSRAIQTAIAEHRDDLESSAADVEQRRARLSRWRTPSGRWPWRWSSASCSTRSVNCCRSDIRSPIPSSIPIATICWRPRRGWRVSSPSPRATCRRGTVPARPDGDSGLARVGFDLLVGVDV